MKIKEKLVQRDIYAFEMALKKAGGYERSALNVTAERFLKAGIAAKMIEEPGTEVGEFDGETRYFIDGENVDEMNPGMVRKLGNEIAAAYSEAIEIPKN